LSGSYQKRRENSHRAPKKKQGEENSGEEKTVWKKTEKKQKLTGETDGEGDQSKNPGKEIEL